jgi:hypothetical protein
MEDKIMNVSNDVKRKSVNFIAAFVVAVALFCMWFAGEATKGEED